MNEDFLKVRDRGGKAGEFIYRQTAGNYFYTQLEAKV